MLMRARTILGAVFLLMAAAVTTATADVGSMPDATLSVSGIYDSPSLPGSGGPEDAFDGSSQTMWNSGDWPPGWIRVDFDSPQMILALEAQVAQLPTPAWTVHEVHLDSTVVQWAGLTADYQWLSYSPPDPLCVDSLEIRTTSSPSWVAWREIEIQSESCDPAVLIADLVGQVLDLNLDHGIANSLDAKLANAQKALADINDNNDGSAINKLEAFINEVQAQAANQVPQEDADALIAAAQQIIDLLTA